MKRIIVDKANTKLHFICKDFIASKNKNYHPEHKVSLLNDGTLLLHHHRTPKNELLARVLDGRPLCFCVWLHYGYTKFDEKTFQKKIAKECFSSRMNIKTSEDFVKYFAYEMLYDPSEGIDGLPKF